MTTAMATPVPDISVVIAAFNEAANIAPMCVELARVLGPLGRYEIIFVEDGSTDGTLDAIRAAARDPLVRYVSLTRNFGHQTCLRAGLRHARGRVVVVMDADFEHPPELLPELLAQWRSGFKVVTTRRLDAAETSWFKRASSDLYYRVLNALGDVKIEPGSADYLLLDRVVVDAVNAIEDHELFLRGAVRWFGYPLATVPYRRGTRAGGETKYSLRRLVELGVSGIAAHSIRPLRFAIWLSLGFAAVGALLIVYSVVSFLFIQRTAAAVGWTSLMAALAILGAVQLLVLGIIGEYVGRILRETRKRPHYVVAETEADLARDAADGRVKSA
jgi:glycosyltransferase involved in cell wall biosynthesis